MKKQITFSEIAKQVYGVYGRQSVLPILFGVASVYREHIVSVTGSFPVLYLKGSFATGKSSLARALQCMFSETDYTGYEPLKMAAVHANLSGKGIAVLDGYRSGDESNEAIKSVYHNADMIKAGADHKPEIKKAQSALIVLSYEFPSDLTILGRSIIVINENTNYSKSQISNFNELIKTLHSKNCNCISELTRHSSFLSNHFEKSLNQSEGALLPLGKSSLHHRIMANYATITAVYECLNEWVDFPFNVEELYIVLGRAISKHDDLI